MLDSFAVIAEPHRRQILDVLRTRNASVNELVEILAISQPAVSKHLRVLRDSGLVRVEPAGQQRIYRLDPEPLKSIDDWLSNYRTHWRDTLENLATHLSATRPTTYQRNPK
jgi:DNA-binding transcriptional ArsR family regulator